MTRSRRPRVARTSSYRTWPPGSYLDDAAYRCVVVAGLQCPVRVIRRRLYRNELIFNDVLLSLEAGRSPVILTERKDHLMDLADRLSKFAKNVIVFHGGMKAKAQKDAERALSDIPDSEKRVLLATGRYLGEGFDDARLDTLFLTMPISWRGLLSQYAGRSHRVHPSKRDVMIYDYVDAREPMHAEHECEEARGLSHTRLHRSVGRRDAVEAATKAVALRRSGCSSV